MRVTRLWKIMANTLDFPSSEIALQVRISPIFLINEPSSDCVEDCELLESMSLSAKAPPKRTLMGIGRTFKFILRDKGKIEILIKKLCSWNDSLNQMSSRLEQESSRRRLRTFLSTGDTTQLDYLEAAASLFKHPDIERMANARNVIEHANRNEPARRPVDMAGTPLSPTAEFRLEMNQLVRVLFGLLLFGIGPFLRCETCFKSPLSPDMSRDSWFALIEQY